MATPVAQSTHQWVQYSVSEVDVIVDPDGQSFVVARPDTAEGVAVGCNVCGEPLTDSSAVTGCSGAETP